MASQWPEISTARKEKRKELTLQGSEISERIENEGLPKELFKLNLNYLVISKTSLVELSDSISKISDLMRLCLPNNKLKSLPASIGSLTKLKLLDLSNNELECLPDELNTLLSLGTLNLSVNKLTKLPAIEGLTALTTFDVSYNQLEYLPDGMCENHDYLTEIKASHNNLVELPDGLNNLARLSTLDVADNKLKDIPFTLCECSKLKEFIGKGNTITERRLSKMVEQGQMKGMMSYLSTELQKKRALESKGEKKPKPKKKKKAKVDDDDVEELTKDMINILHFPISEENGITVSVQVPVITVRPFIVCCIVRKLNFKKSLAMFKHFITLQTKLHDTICEQRQVATIATHELKSIKGPLTYTAEFPDLLKITPLFKLKEVTAKKLVTNLFEDAEALRKEKKRSTISGIHKYLELLKDKVQYPCLKDAEDNVISFPPITNSDKTKISSDTTDILIEVTSSTNLDSCKKVMDELLREMLKMGVGCSEDEEPPSSKEEATEEDGAEPEATPKIPKNHHLVVEQVKIVDHEGSLKVVYPSRTDLLNPQYKVIRNF
ncbi:hypothetical protein LOTGIDRAFT_188753 [Lottia gigantea]|uniref:B3/B4 tRNA-binding domain-containing protein n=1 Tax=Lottia gigantea TaxID=225164 RepID=V4AF39_LOTGI|nr:hypothetical protein LOTGIDRAFT_188753 [Lottia gigantea]ESO95482.1 hypothetical protein LOTGIDRAFT_188753 [Lottia gigantea]